MNHLNRPVMQNTISSKLASTKGHPAGFDYLRLFLASEVLVWHTVLMTHGLEVQNEILNSSPYRAIPSLILPMFFALSGFLVAGSLDRSKSVFDFFCLRLLRIYPALCLVVLWTALLFGPFVSTYPLDRYFSEPQFSHYFLTLIGNVQLGLPGLFYENPFPTVVNGQLWTIPLEMICYIIIGISALLGIYRKRALFLACVIFGQLIFAARPIFGAPIIWGSVPSSVLFLCFFAGSTLSLYRQYVPYRNDLAFLSALFAFGLIYIPGGSYFIALPAAYLTVFLGLRNPYKNIIVRSGDYSYGLYLFAFPVQQLIASSPLWSDKWYANLLLSYPITFCLAILSWHLLEKRALALRKEVPHFHSWLRNFLSRSPLRRASNDKP